MFLVIDLQTTMVIVWIGIFILAAVIEAMTMDLSSVWFSAGAIFALIVTLFNGSIVIQMIVFIVASVVLLLAVRPAFKESLKRNEIKTNADSLVGKTAVCTEAISPEDRGEVKIEGKIWTAISNEAVSVGEKVTVLAIKGVKLVVRKQ